MYATICICQPYDSKLNMNKKSILSQLKKKFFYCTALLIVMGAAQVYAVEVNSLRGKTAIDAPSVTVQNTEWKDGEGKIDREFRVQPPMIPHKTEGYDINLQVHTCLGCHSWGNAKFVGATKVAISHYINRKGVQTADISGNRYFCVQCHAPQKKVAPLIPNEFQAAVQ